VMGDGGKWICGLEHIQKKKKCVIYSFGKMHPSRCGPGFRRFLTFLTFRAPGINGESSFEAELLEKAPGCQVWGYDFSVSGVSFPSQSPNPTTVLTLYSGDLSLGLTLTELISSPGHSAPSITMVPT